MSFPAGNPPYPGYPYVPNRFYPTAQYFAQNALPLALELIIQSVGAEREDDLFYTYMLGVAPPAQRPIIESIRDDERKHILLFRELYWELTGREVPPGPEEPFEQPASYCQGITRALFGELNAVERYRQVLWGFEFLPYRNIVTEIYTDELKHATKWNYLFSLNCIED